MFSANKYLLQTFFFAHKFFDYEYFPQVNGIVENVSAHYFCKQYPIILHRKQVSCLETFFPHTNFSTWIFLQIMWKIFLQTICCKQCKLLLCCKQVFSSKLFPTHKDEFFPQINSALENVYTHYHFCKSNYCFPRSSILFQNFFHADKLFNMNYFRK